MAYWQFPKYVSVAEKRAKAEKKRKQLLKKNKNLNPVEIEGSALAATWWGKAWNKNLERYADYTNRIGRGRSYVRHGAVLDLQIAPGEVTALVQGSVSRPYEITVKIKKISTENWKSLKKACEGRFDSLKVLLAGKFPKALETLFTEKGKGLFPTPDEITFSCSCPDWAGMCKHVAATLYGIGARLDDDPQLFFKLRDVAVADLISETVAESARDLLQKAEKKTGRILEGSDISDLFGIDMDSTDDFDRPDDPPFQKQLAVPKKPIRPAGRKKAAKRIPLKTLKKADMNHQKIKKTKKPDPVIQPTVSDDLAKVEKIINKRKKGITTAELVEKTGLDTARVRYLVSRLKTRGKIKTLAWGLYAGVSPFIR